jgi:hypothetical protein
LPVSLDEGGYPVKRRHLDLAAASGAVRIPGRAARAHDRGLTEPGTG